MAIKCRSQDPRSSRHTGTAVVLGSEQGHRGTDRERREQIWRHSRKVRALVRGDWRGSLEASDGVVRGPTSLSSLSTASTAGAYQGKARSRASGRQWWQSRLQSFIHSKIFSWCRISFHLQSQHPISQCLSEFQLLLCWPSFLSMRLGRQQMMAHVPKLLPPMWDNRHYGWCGHLGSETSGRKIFVSPSLSL